MNTTRRLFSRWLGAAPLAIGAVAASPRGVAEKASHYDLAGTVGLRNHPQEWKPAPDPAGVAQYWNARAELNNANKYKNWLGTARREQHNGGFPPTIDCLKSVSNVHKYHMMVQRRIKQKEDEKSFTDMLMDKFGVRDWFQKRNDSQIEAASNYSGGM